MKLKLKPGMTRRPREAVDKFATAVRRKIELRKARRRVAPAMLDARLGRRFGEAAPEALLGLRRFVANPRRFGLLVRKRIRARWPNHDGTENQSGCCT